MHEYIEAQIWLFLILTFIDRSDSVMYIMTIKWAWPGVNIGGTWYSFFDVVMSITTVALFAVSRSTAGLQEALFSFHLTPRQIQDISVNRYEL